MKKLMQNLPANKRFQLYCICGLALLLLVIPPGKINAQADSIATNEETQETTYAPLIEFTSVQKNDRTIDLKASVKAKVSGTLIKLQGFKVEFISVSDSAEQRIGEGVTDRNGIALFNCKPDQLATDTGGRLNFKAVFVGKDSFEAGEEVLAIKRGHMEITPVKGDSLFTVQLKLIDLSTGSPISEVPLGIFVKRMFSSLKVGEGTTDENGEASIEIANNLPGDVKGNLTLIAKIEDNEIYGNLEATVIQKWGVPVSDEVKELPRALWSPHPPLWMVITFIVLMTAVWGHYFIIIFELFRLRKEEPKVDVVK